MTGEPRRCIVGNRPAAPKYRRPARSRPPAA